MMSYWILQSPFDYDVEKKLYDGSSTFMQGNAYRDQERRNMREKEEFELREINRMCDAIVKGEAI